MIYIYIYNGFNINKEQIIYHVITRSKIVEAIRTVRSTVQFDIERSTTQDFGGNRK
jgi:hypothetical protein